MAAVVLLALIAGGAWFLFLRDGAPISLAEEREVPEFSFDLGTIRGFPVAEPADKEDIESVAEDIRDRLDALYVAAFIDPSKWEGGEFPEVLDAFSGPAAKKAKKDLGSFTIGVVEARHVRFVEPEPGRLNIRFLVSTEESPVGAVADAHFSAKGELRDGRTLAIVHNGTYYMAPVEGDWLIVGYKVDGAVQPGEIGPPEKEEP
jgi:hypothetical protein